MEASRASDWGGEFDQGVDALGPLPRGRHGLPREAVAGSQRARIIRAMIDASAERGYADTRVVDVIERAGVSRKTFYEFFDDIEDCFLASYDHVSARLFQTAAGGFGADETAPWADRVRAGLGAFLELIAGWPQAARFAIIEVLAAGPKALLRRDAALRQLTELIDAGRNEADTELPPVVSRAVLGGVYELLYSEILHGATANLPSRLPDLMYWVTQPFLGPDGAAAERERARRQLSDSA